MFNLDDIADDFSTHWGKRHHLPEYRQIELYSKKKTLAFTAPDTPDPKQLQGCLSTETAFMMLESHLLSLQPALEGLPSWKKYLALSKENLRSKLVAEVYRILRIHHLAWILPDGHLAREDGLIRIRCVFERCHLAMTISPVGIELLESFVFYCLDAQRQPYSDAYVEAMLCQYFNDIVAEIKGFSDEDRVLYQYRQTLPINRHFRFDNDHPRFEVDQQHLVIDMGKRHTDPRAYPIDFYLIFDDLVHIIPVEALSDGRLPLADLPKWQARLAEGAHLPDSFRYRFGREKNIVGLPMT